MRRSRARSDTHALSPPEVMADVEVGLGWRRWRTRNSPLPLPLLVRGAEMRTRASNLRSAVAN